MNRPREPIEPLHRTHQSVVTAWHEVRMRENGLPISSNTMCGAREHEPGEACSVNGMATAPLADPTGRGHRADRIRHHGITASTNSRDIF
jgi:hypothetical protein